MSRLIHNLTNSPNLVERIKGIDRSIDTLNDKVGSIPEGMDVGQSIIDLQNNKQDLLIAGEGIYIENNVISNTYSAEWGDISGEITDQTDLQDALDSISGSIPTNTSDLTNDSGFITNSVNNLINYYLKSETYTKTEVDNLIGSIQNFHYEIYPNLGSITTPATNVLYLIGPTGTGSDRYEEYVYSNDNFVKIGDTSIDLSGYVTTTDLNTALSNYTTTANLTTLLAQKQDILTAGAGISIINNVISNTIPGATISNTAPLNPTQGTLWYDTVNDVLKSYDGSIWSEVGNESVDINTKTFHLSGTSDLTNAQAAYDWFSAGKNPIVMYNNRAYLIYAKNATQLIFQDIENSAYDQYSYTEYVGQKIIFTLSGNDVTAINYNSTSGWSGPILRTDIDYPTPYIPQYDGSPATKKYVDEHAGTAYTAGANIQISAQNVISATDTTYTAGTGISIDANNVISNTQTSAEWGNITGDISDQTDLINLINTKQNLLTEYNAGRDIEIINGDGGDETVTGNTSILLEDAIEDGLNSVTLTCACEQRDALPSEYQRVEYLQSSGTQYIKTGYIPTSDIVEYGIEIYGAPNDSSSLFGAQESSGSPKYTGIPFTTANTTRIYIGSTSAVASVSIRNNQWNKYVLQTTSSTAGKVTLNGVDTDFTYTNGIMKTLEIYLFANNQSDSATQLSSIQVKSFYIKDNGVLIRNYVPAKNASNVIGLYDLVSRQFFTNQGTGDFTAGADVTTPSPDNIMPIWCNNGALKVSKNLFNKDNETNWGNWYSSNSQIAQSPANITAIIKCLPNTTYYFKHCLVRGGLRAFYTEVENWTEGSACSDMVGSVTSDANIVQSITTSANAKWLFVCFGRVDQNSTVPLEEQAGDFMLSTSVLATETPYISYGIYTDGTVETVADSSSNTATAEMLLSVGNYKDTQEILTGAVTRNVGIKALDGTENWEATTSGYYSLLKTYLGTDSTVLPFGSLDIICTHYSVASVQTENKMLVGNSYVNWYVPTAFTTLASWKQYLASQYIAGTPVIIVYPLATPTAETVTGQTLTTIIGDNTLTITQASIDELPIEANYDKILGLVISFVNDDGFQTVANMKTDLNNPDDTHYPTTKAVADAIQGAGGGDMMKSTYDPNNVEANVYDYNNFINTPTIPSKTSDLTNDSGFITSASVPTKTSDLTNDSGFITSSSLPTKTSDLTNDSGFITSSALPTKVSDLTNDSGFITGISGNDVTTALGYTPANNANLGTAATKNTGTSSGNVPVLDSNGHLASSVIPGVALTDTFTVTASSDLTTLSNADQGDIAIVTSENKTYVLSQAPYSTAANWKQILTPTEGVTSVNGQTGAVTLSIPTDTSDLTNGAGYITSSDIPTDYVKTSGNQTIAGTKTFSTSPVVPSKTTAATNSGTKIATEAQVYKKQDTISDLATIRSGAAAGATALQPGDVPGNIFLTQSAYDALPSSKTSDGNTYIIYS